MKHSISQSGYVTGQDMGDCADAHRRWSGLRPEPASRLGHSATIDYRGTLRPTFTCRSHKVPHPRGHRQWLKLEGR